MKDVENDYLQFVRSKSEFVCVRKLFFKVVIRCSNDSTTRRKYCVPCIKNVNGIKEDFNFIDFKAIILKKKHILFTLFGSTRYAFNDYTCDNCSEIIKDYACSSSCEECKNLIEDNEFMKQNINSVLNLPEELTYRYFIKNYDNLENVFPDRLLVRYSKYTIIHRHVLSWSEAHFFSLSNENEQEFVVKNEFNDFKTIELETVVFEENFREEEIKIAIKKTCTKMQI